MTTTATEGRKRRRLERRGGRGGEGAWPLPLPSTTPSLLRPSFGQPGLFYPPPTGPTIPVSPVF